jgi:hypothetical protein
MTVTNAFEVRSSLHVGLSDTPLWPARAQRILHSFHD